MASRKIIVVAVSIVLVITAMVSIALGARGWAASKVSKKLTDKLAPYGLQVKTQLSSAVSGFSCFDSLVIENPGRTQIVMNRVCLTDGLVSLVTDNPDFSIRVEDVSGFVDGSIHEHLEGHDSGSTSSGMSSGLIKNMTVSAVFDKVDLSMRVKGQTLRWRGESAEFELNKGIARIDSRAQLFVDLKKFPVAVSSIPEIQAAVTADLNEKTVRFEMTSEPAVELTANYKNQNIEAGISGLTGVMASANSSISLKKVSVSMPGIAGMAGADIDEIQAEFSKMIPGPDAVEKLRFISPTIRLDINGILASKNIAQHPILGAMIAFWQQDAGAILGDAPKDSVRREDVKKNKKVIRKNPVSPEKLEKIRQAFNKVQQKVMAWPSVEIKNGRIDIASETDHYEFSSISFNTSELLQNTQKFQLTFNVRDASAMFVFAYDTDSPFPVIAFDVRNLVASDFLHIINMPVPDKNSGTVSLNLTMSMSEDDFRLSGSIVMDEFAFYHEKISPNLIQNMNASAVFEAQYSFPDDKVVIRPLTLTSGPVTAQGFVNISNVRSAPLIEFELGADDIACTDIPKAIPDGFLPTITELRFIGTTMSPRITGKIPWKSPLTSSLKESGFENRCFPVSVAPHFPERLNDPDYTFTTDYTYFAESITVGPGTKEYTPLEEIPPYVKAAMFLTEDKRFFDHGPLRIAFVERALRLNLNQRSYVYGGSTIAQQLTKNLFLNRTKNLARKLEEAFIAWRLECVVPRLRIFELYINMIEFGPDIYGIHKASKFYFDKEPKDLTPLEGAYLASLKVAPSKGGRYYKYGFAQNGRWWHKRLRYILKTLAENGYISAAEAIAAYDWTPEFVYPTSASDFRQVWLNRYGEYMRDKAKKKKANEENGAREKNEMTE